MTADRCRWTHGVTVVELEVKSKEHKKKDFDPSVSQNPLTNIDDQTEPSEVMTSYRFGDVGLCQNECFRPWNLRTGIFKHKRRKWKIHISRKPFVQIRPTSFMGGGNLWLTPRHSIP